MELLLQDVRYAIRLLFKRPLFATVAVVTLALGIGANTAIFSVVDAVLLAPLAYPEPDRLMMIWAINSSSNADQQPASVPDFDDLKEQSQSFDEIAASRSQAFNLTDGDEPERVVGARVTVNMFSALAVKPVVGRDFLESEGLAGAEPVVILSHSLWQQLYRRRPRNCRSCVEYRW